MKQTDEELMKRYQSGDNSAMHEIFQHNKNRILNFCYGLLGNRADAEEISSDVFLQLMKSHQSYDSTRTFSTWIFTIARNLCLNRIQKRKQTVSIWFSSSDKGWDEFYDVPDSKMNSQDAASKKEMVQKLNRAICELPFEQKEVLELR